MFSKVFGLALIASCCAFLWIDYQWQLLLETAVSNRAGTYGESYGPLSFLRPLVLSIAMLLSIVAAVLVMKHYAHREAQNQP